MKKARIYRSEEGHYSVDITGAVERFNVTADNFDGAKHEAERLLQCLQAGGFIGEVIRQFSGFYQQQGKGPDSWENQNPVQDEYCTQNGGDCVTCSLNNYGRDCQNNPIASTC